MVVKSLTKTTHRVCQVKVVSEVTAVLVSHPKQSSIHGRRFLGLRQPCDGVRLRARAGQDRLLQEDENFLLDVLVLLLGAAEKLNFEKLPLTCASTHVSSFLFSRTTAFLFA